MNASNVQYLIDLVNYIDELERERGQLHADMKLAISRCCATPWRDARNRLW